MLTEDAYKNGQVLLIDKPLTWTSFQVVNKIRFAIQRKFGLKKLKVGHAGTLDPLATGLLIVCTGKFTKQIDTFQAQVKTYTGSFTLGATTPSYDKETEVNQIFSTAHITDELIKITAKNFEGIRHQKPPIYSAIKQEGRRLYDLAQPGGGTTDYAVEIYFEALKANKYTCFLSENATLPMMYMDDAIRATYTLMAQPKMAVYKAYNIAGMSLNPKEMSKSIQKQLPDFSISYQPDFRQAIAESWPKSIDDSEAKADWNWKPEFDLDHMTKVMLAHCK